MSEILDHLQKAQNKGTLLELVTEDIFIDNGFDNVSRQKSGSQYGYDVVGYKDDKCWKAECKNLGQEANINDISPKLVWHIDSYFIDRFVIVSVNGISNDLRLLLEQKLFSFPIEVWSEKYLEKLILSSPKACARLGLDQTKYPYSENEKPLMFPPNALLFDVYYHKGLPYSYDYFFLDNELIKAYTDHGFGLTAMISNPTTSTVAIQAVNIKTIRYRKTQPLRILRQFKAKGIIEPIELRFSPRPYTSGEVELLNKNLIEVKSNSEEYIHFELSKGFDAGYYELLIEIDCISNGRQISLFSGVIPLHKNASTNNLVSLMVVSRYYDTPVDHILKLPPKEWHLIKKEYKNVQKYLGPTMNDLSQNRVYGKFWEIRTTKGKTYKEGNTTYFEVGSNTKSRSLLKLSLPVEEKIHTAWDSIKKFI